MIPRMAGKRVRRQVGKVRGGCTCLHEFLPIASRWGGYAPPPPLPLKRVRGVLHSPDYRATYAQFLKIDLPRIPYPPSPEMFAHVAEKGGALRRLHLMEDAAIGDTLSLLSAMAIMSWASLCLPFHPPHRFAMGRRKWVA